MTKQMTVKDFTKQILASSIFDGTPVSAFDSYIYYNTGSRSIK